jgi:hypothetical protein
MIPRIIGSRRQGMSVETSRVRRWGKSLGAVALGLVALDLVATVATLALGATWLKR